MEYTTAVSMVKPSSSSKSINPPCEVELAPVEVQGRDETAGLVEVGVPKRARRLPQLQRLLAQVIEAQLGGATWLTLDLGADVDVEGTDIVTQDHPQCL